MTVDDLFAMEPVSDRYELFDGEVYMVPPPNVWHQNVVVKLSRVLDTHVTRENLGWVFVAPTGLILTQENYVEPDLIFVSTERHTLITKRGIEGVPDLVVEVLSPSTRRRDLRAKFQLYARFGVPHYWVVDSEGRNLVAFELRGAAYAEVAAHGEREVFRPSLFPGLEISLPDLWPTF
jgi:Uma2 family endonuclease